MKKILIGSALLAASIGVASAADLPAAAPIYTKAPPPPAWSWTGFYIGGNAGGAFDGSSNASFAAATPAIIPFFLANEFPTSLNTNPSGFVGGGQIGYNWQMNSWLIGLEADFQGANYKGSDTLTPVPTGVATFSTTVEQHSNWFGTVRGRLGWLVTPAFLIYGTGGLAYGQAEVSFNTFPVAFACTAAFTCANGSSTSTRTGWTAGGGLEYMFAPRWSARAEYLFVDLGTQSVTAPSFSAGPAFAFTASAKFQENVVRGAINYHF